MVVDDWLFEFVDWLTLVFATAESTTVIEEVIDVEEDDAVGIALSIVFADDWSITFVFFSTSFFRFGLLVDEIDVIDDEDVVRWNVDEVDEVTFRIACVTSSVCSRRPGGPLQL